MNEADLRALMRKYGLTDAWRVALENEPEAREEIYTLAQAAGLLVKGGWKVKLIQAKNFDNPECKWIDFEPSLEPVTPIKVTPLLPIKVKAPTAFVETQSHPKVIRTGWYYIVFGSIGILGLLSIYDFSDSNSSGNDGSVEPPKNSNVPMRNFTPEQQQLISSITSFRDAISNLSKTSQDFFSAIHVKVSVDSKGIPDGADFFTATDHASDASHKLGLAQDQAKATFKQMSDVYDLTFSKHAAKSEIEEPMSYVRENVYEFDRNASIDEGYILVTRNICDACNRMLAQVSSSGSLWDVPTANGAAATTDATK